MTFKSTAQLLLLSLVWGMSFLLIRVAGGGFPPLWIGLMRSLLGASLIWAVIALTRRRPPARRFLPWLLLVALFNNAIPFTCFAWGERVVPSNTASVLNATTPIWTLLLTMAVHRAAARLTVIAGVLVGFAGVVLVVINQSSIMPASVTHAEYLRGVLLIVIGTLGYAIATVIAKARLKGVDPFSIAATQLSLSGVLIAPLALATAHPDHITSAQAIAMTVLGFVGGGVAYLLYFNLLATVSATQVVAVTYLLPIWGIFWGFVAHEHIGSGTFLGVAIAIAGLILMNLRPPSVTPPAQAISVSAGEPSS